MSGEQQRRLILHMSMSLDGFVAHTDGDIDWLGPSRTAPDSGGRRHEDNVEMFGQIGTIVIGRVAYEQMVQAWPGTDSPMGRLMNKLPKVIFSDTLETIDDWENARVNEKPLAEEIRELKSEPGGDIVVIGGGQIGNALIGEGLIDELRLTTHPVALGEGISLMHGLPEPQRFELVSGTVHPDGCIVQVLLPA